jgi:hypothetical protein
MRGVALALRRLDLWSVGTDLGLRQVEEMHSEASGLQSKKA